MTSYYIIVYFLFEKGKNNIYINRFQEKREPKKPRFCPENEKCP